MASAPHKHRPPPIPLRPLPNRPAAAPSSVQSGVAPVQAKLRPPAAPPAATRPRPVPPPPIPARPAVAAQPARAGGGVAFPEPAGAPRLPAHAERPKPVVFRPTVLPRQAAVAQRASVALTDEERYRRNHQQIGGALAAIYATFYSAGARNATDVKVIYGMLGKERSGYLAEKVTPEAFAPLVVDEKGNADYFVHKQIKKKKDHKDAKDGKGKIVAKTDIGSNHYYHVHNKHYVKPASRKGLVRRIIVNVTTQAHALAVANALIGLYRSAAEADRAVAKHIAEFKVYIGNKGGDSVKKDKLVIYYDYVAGPAGADTVGDKIVSVVSASGAEFGEDLAPFYSTVAKGIAWAEEPKYHSDEKAMKRSFTRTRANVISEVIEQNDRVPSLDIFIGLVAAGFKRYGIDLSRAHRHS